jgi:hypothetical protein
MARIPTINAQNITPPPGSAGGVLLGKTGVSNIQIKTPLTQQLNPSQFGQEGAALSNMGSSLLNKVYFPMLAREQANAKAEQTLKENTRIYGELTSLKTKLAKDYLVLGEDYHHPAGKRDAWSDHWSDINTRLDKMIPDIESRVTDKKQAVALINNYMPQIMALKLKATNRRAQISTNNVIDAYQKGVKTLAEEMAKLVPFDASAGGEDTYIFQGAQWDQLIQKKQLLDNVFQNTAMDPVKKAEVLASTRKTFITELTGAFEGNPKMGMEFLMARDANGDSLSEKFGLTPGETNGMLTKLDKLSVDHAKREQWLADQVDQASQDAARNELAPVRVNHWKQALEGKIDIYRWMKDYRKMYEDADDLPAFDAISKVLVDFEDKPGTTKADVYSKFEFRVQTYLGDPTKENLDALATEIGSEKWLSKPDKLKFLNEIGNLKNNANLLKFYKYTQAKETLARSAPVPLDSLDTSAAALRNRAMWRLFSDDVNRLMKDPKKFMDFDWHGRVTQMIDEHSGNWGDPSDEGAQIFFKDFVRSSGMQGVPNVVVGGGGDSKLIYPDVNAMKAHLNKMVREKKWDKEKIRQANDSIHSLETFPGLSEKVGTLKEAARLANQPPPELELTNTEKVLRYLTPDKAEAWMKKNHPDYYKGMFGKKPGEQPQPEPAPQPEPQPEPEQQTEMFPEETQPAQQWDYQTNLNKAREAIQYLKTNAEKNNYDPLLIDLADLTLLSLQADADLDNKESFEQTWKTFMKQVGDIQGTQ